MIQASLEDVEDWELFDRDSTVDSTIVRVEPLTVNVAPPAAASSPAPPSGSSTLDVPPSADGLAPTQGFLRIETAERVPVSVHGAAVGTTNEWLAVKCGPRFVRLGTPERWLDAGSMEVVPCRKHVSLARRLVGP